MPSDCQCSSACAFNTIVNKIIRTGSKEANKLIATLQREVENLKDQNKLLTDALKNLKSRSKEDVLEKLRRALDKM